MTFGSYHRTTYAKHTLFASHLILHHLRIKMRRWCEERYGLTNLVKTSTVYPFKSRQKKEKYLEVWFGYTLRIVMLTIIILNFTIFRCVGSIG